MKPRRSCELCEGDAAVYCEPDSAFLCWACDSAVHGANILAARYVQWITCSDCRSLDAGHRIFSAGRRIFGADFFADPLHVLLLRTRSRLLAIVDELLSLQHHAHDGAGKAGGEKAYAAMAAAVAAIIRGAKEDARVVGILVSWIRRVRPRAKRRCIGTRAHVLDACLGVVAMVPFQIALAAALWFARRRKGWMLGDGPTP